MFKKLKDKIEEVKQSPLKITQIAQAVVSPTSSSIIEPVSNANFSITEDGEDTPHNSPSKEGFQAVDLRDIPSPLPSGRRSRQSSISSITSDASSLFPIYEMPLHSFNLQSDLESASEMDEGSSSQLAYVSKQELYHAYLKLKRRYQKYKGRSNDLLNYCRDLDKDNKKHKNVLLDCQEKSIRRISELKEQCALEQRAKAHLEEALRNDLEEKDHLIQTLHTKVKLLKENSAASSSVASESTLIDLSEQPDTASSENMMQHESQFSDQNKSLWRNHDTKDDILQETRQTLEGDMLKANLENKEATIESLLEAKRRLNDTIKSIILKLDDMRTNIGSEALETIPDDVEHNSVLDEKSSVSENGGNGTPENNNTKNYEINVSGSQNMYKLSNSHEGCNEQMDEIDIMKQAEFKILALTSDVGALKKKVLKAENNFEACKKEKQMLITVLVEYGKSTRALKETVNELKQEASTSFVIMNEKNMTMMHKLLENVNVFSHAMDVLEKENRSLMKQLVSCDSKLKQREDELQIEYNKNLCTIRDKLDQKCQEFCILQEVTGRNCEALQVESMALKELNDTLQLENNNLKSAMLVLEVQANNVAVDKIQEIALLNDRLALAIEERERIAEKNTELTIITNQLNSHIQELTNELQAVKRENDFYVMEREELQSSLKKVQCDILSKNLDLAHIEREEMALTNVELSKIPSQLHAHIRQLTDELEALKLDNDRHVKERDELQSSLKKMQHDGKVQLDILSEKLTLANEEKEHMVLSSAELSKIPSQLNDHIQQLTDELKALKLGNDCHVKERDELQSSLKKIQHDGNVQLDILSDNLALANEEKEKLILTNAELVKVQSQLHAHIQELTTKLQAVNEDNDTHIREWDELQSSLNTMQHFGEVKPNILSDKLAHIEGLTYELQSAKANNDLYVKERDELKSSLKSLQQNSKLQMHMLNDKLTSAINENEALTSNNNKLIAHVQILTAELETVKEETEARLGVLQRNSMEEIISHLEALTVELQAVKAENILLVAEVKELKSSLDHANNSAELEIDMLNEKLNLASTANTELTNGLNTHIQQLGIESEAIKLQNKNNLEKIETLRTEKAHLEVQLHTNCVTSNEELETLRRENGILALEMGNMEIHLSCIEQLQEKNKNVSSERDDLQKKLNIEINHAKTLNSTLNKYKSDMQLLKRKVQQLVVDKILLEQQVGDFHLIIEEKENRLLELDEEHTQRIKQLAIDLEKQLAEKDQEQQNVQMREFEHVEDEERQVVRLLRNQVRDVMEEYQKGNDAYETLLEKHKAVENAKEADKLTMEQHMKDLQLSHENEMNEMNKKWRVFHKKELEQVQEKHKVELSDLSREWYWERKDASPNSNEISSQELESTSQLAVAAVESGTGSIELLHKQVVALTQDLKEAKHRHRLEVAELNNLLSLRQRNPEGELCTFHDKSIEMEYVRNIMYQYMMGKEPMLLAKVIATVMKFDPEQTNQIVQKELQKQTLLGQLGIL